MRKWLVGLLAAALCASSAWADDELTRETTGVTGSSYTEWTATGDSGAKYAGQSAGGNESIQLRAQSPAGIVMTESSGSDVASVTVEWNDATAEKRSVEIYGSTSAYAGPADLYGDGKGTLLGTIARTATTLEVPEGYPYIGILAKGGALYLSSVTIGFAGSGEFSVTFDKANWFEVEQGTASSVTAIAKNGAEPYTYEWSCDKSELLTGTEATLAIPDTLEADDYTLACLVTDADLNAINALIGLRVVAPKAKFPVTVAEGIEHGTVTVDKEEAIEGETVTVTATAEAGYKLDSLTYNGTDISGNTFAMPAEAVEVNATFVEKPAVSGDELTRETTGVTGSSYTEWTATGDSGAKYAGQSAGGNESIQLRAQSPAGIVITESAGSDVASVTVEWNDATAEKRSLEIYGSATAYAGPADLYGDGKGTLLGTIARTDTTLEVPEGYPYVGILAKGGALYLTSVVIDFAGRGEFSVTFDKENWFEVEQGTASSVTAIARNGAEPYTYEWSCDQSELLTGTEATLAIPDTLEAGDYSLFCLVTDADSNAINAGIGLRVVEPKAKFPVTVAEGIEHGTVTVDKEEAVEGEIVTVTATADSGYKLDSLTYNGTAISGNTFAMPGEAVEVNATFVEKPAVSGDELTRETTGVTGSSYTEWTATGDSGAKYAGQSAGGNESIQLRAQSPAGIVITESSGSDVASVTVEWNDATAEKRSLEIYGSTTAYAGPADLYGDGKGTLLGTIARTDTTLEVPEGYPYVGILAKGGALYLSSVTIGFAGASGPSVSLSASATEVEVGEPVTITATAKNFSAEVDWSWTGNGTADGATFAVDTSVAGTYEVTATATAGEETASKSVTITVKAPAVKYQIECAVGIPNGSVSADKTEAEEGETVTLAADPADGYKLGTFLLDGDPISGNSFEMPAHDVLVSAEFVEKPPVTGDVLTNDDVGSQTSSYKDWTATKDSGAVYAGQTAGGSATNPCIQLRSSNNSGIVMTKDSGQNVSSVTIEWNAQSAAERVVQVYGSTTAYSSPADLYGDAKGTLLAEFTNGSGEVTVDVAAVGEFPYIGIRSKSGALYLTSVAIDFGGAAAFSIALDPAEDFEVPQGTDAAITATVRGAQGDVTYSWSVNGTPIDLAGNVYAIDSTEVGGPYEVVCEASDGVSDPVSASVSYSVVEVPPVTGDEFTLITSVDDLEDGAEYVITDNSQAYAIKSVLSDGSTKRLLNESVTPVEGVITTDDASIIWKLVAVEGGSFAFYNDSIGKYIGWSSGNSAKFQDDAFANTISYEDNLFVVMATSTAELEKPRKLQFNSASTSLQFAYYEGTQKNLCFFKKSDGPGPQPGEPALVFGGDSEGTVDTPVNFTVEAINMANTDIYGGWTEHEGLFDAPEGSALSDAGVTQDFPNVSFTPDVAGQYVFYFNAGEGDEYREGSWTVTVTGEGPGPQPSDAAITKMTIASGKMTIEFTGTAPQVLLSDDMQTWTAVDGAISPFEFNMDEAGKKYIGVR